MGIEQTPPEIFDRHLVGVRRTRSAAKFSNHNFLHRRAMEDIIDRLETVTREFPLAAFFGAGRLIEMLTPACGVGDIIAADLSPARLDGLTTRKNLNRLGADEEKLPFAPGSLDLIVSLLTLHNANDLIGAMVQSRIALKPDGLFIAAVFGEESLKSMRAALYAAETAETGGVTPRIAPFASVRDLGSALQRAGFALPVADLDRVRVRYETPLGLIEDLRGMGETSCLHEGRQPLIRRTATRFLAEHGGPIETEFDIIFLTGWAPHESQQKPLAPGSAKESMKKAVLGD